MTSMHDVNVDVRARSRPNCDDLDVLPHPTPSSFKIEWRGVLGSARFAPYRRRICELRANRRNQSSGGKWSMSDGLSHIAEIIEQKVLEAWLGAHKQMAKIRRSFQ